MAQLLDRGPQCPVADQPQENIRSNRPDPGQGCEQLREVLRSGQPSNIQQGETALRQVQGRSWLRSGRSAVVDRDQPIPGCKWHHREIGGRGPAHSDDCLEPAGHKSELQLPPQPKRGWNQPMAGADNHRNSGPMRGGSGPNRDQRIVAMDDIGTAAPEGPNQTPSHMPTGPGAVDEY